MAFSGEHMIVKKEGAIGWLIFNNPEKRNSFTEDMWNDMAEALDDFQADPAIRVVIYRGAGGKAFCAGADLKSQARRLEGPEAIRSFADSGARARDAQDRFRKPVISMIEGYCIGGGLAIAMRSDIRIGNQTSRYGIPAAKLSFAYPLESIEALTHLVGPGHAKAILFGARQMDAAEAFRIGLIDYLVPDAELETYVRSFAGEVAQNAPLSIAHSKLVIDMVTHGRVDAEKIRASGAHCQNSADCVEGITANKEKRKPVFTGK